MKAETPSTPTFRALLCADSIILTLSSTAFTYATDPQQSNYGDFYCRRCMQEVGP